MCCVSCRLSIRVSEDIGNLVKVCRKSQSVVISNAVVQILRTHGIKYDVHDVGIGEGNAQTRYKGLLEFVGGCEIMLHMHQTGELVEELEEAGITSALLLAEEDSSI